MSYEDDLSFLTGLYYDALQRQRDYERYYIIASRYGPFNEVEFQQDTRPGKRYYAKITKGALKLQLVWDRYWAMAKFRRFRACRMIQKIWRGYSTYKKLHPIIRLRMKIGKKTYYMYSFAQWKEYIRFCRWIRESIRYFNSNYVERCFHGWKSWARETRETRKRRMGKVLLRARSPLLYRFFRYWKSFRKYIQSLRGRLKLFFSFPHFYIWKEYMKQSKLLKKLHRNARILQYAVRTFLIRCHFLQKRKAKVWLNLFAFVILAKGRVHRVRQQYIQQNFDEWLPTEILRRAHQANELEKQRLQKKQVYLQDREKMYVKELVRFLSSADGVHQLQYISRTALDETLRDRKKSRLVAHMFGLSTTDKHRIYNHHARMLRDECVSVTRQLESFTYDSKAPPTIQCPHPRCAATFTAEEQYHHHYFVSSLHQEEEQHVFCHLQGYQPSMKATVSLVKVNNAGDFVMNYTHFHMMIRHKKGQEIFRNYFLRVYGLSGAINVLDCWIALQDWKKQSATSTAFYQKAFNIYELYVSVDGTRRLDWQEVSWSNRGHVTSIFERLHSLVISNAVAHDTAWPSSASPSKQSVVISRHRKAGREDSVVVGSTPAHPYNSAHRDPLSFPGFFRTIDVDFVQRIQQQYQQLQPGSSALKTLFSVHDVHSSSSAENGAATTSVTDLPRTVESTVLPSHPTNNQPNREATLVSSMLPASPDPPSIHSAGGPLSLLACFGWGIEGLTMGQVIWTPEMILLPSIFEDLEYACFKSLYLAFKHEEASFKLSSAYRDYEATLKHDQQLMEEELRRDYERSRWQIVRDWARHFKAYDNVIVARAEQVCDQITDDVVEHFWQRAARREVYRQGQVLHLTEQAAHEETALLRDEALGWTEENILTGIFDFYVRSFLTAMWDVPNHRKGMLQYSGLMKVNMRKRGPVGIGGGNEKGAGVRIGRSDAGLGRLIAEVSETPSKPVPAEEFNVWFESFLAETVQRERATIPVTKDAAARCIQRRVRGMLARHVARKEFAKRYKKYFDDGVQAYYYHDSWTDEASWQRPRVFRYLYPHGNW